MPARSWCPDCGQPLTGNNCNECQAERDRTRTRPRRTKPDKPAT